MKLTKATVEAASPPIDKDQIFYRDDQLKGFALRVTASGVKSFVVETSIGNKVKRITLGRFGVLTVEVARNEAKKMLGQIATGIDPIAERKHNKAKCVTLKEVFIDYLKARKGLKPTTIKDYERVMKEAFAPWINKSILDITKDMVAKRHITLGEASEARANLAMRLLRALFNFAIGQYEDAQGRSVITENPVKRLSQSRAWFRVERRQNFIKAHELKPWYEAVSRLENDTLGEDNAEDKADSLKIRAATLRDYLLLMIFTGLRRQEGAQLKWGQVDLIGKTLVIRDPKNRENHNLPIPEFLFDLLSRRKASSNSEYVFPGNGKRGYIIEPRKQMDKVINKSGIFFTLHDLRRTFITLAEGLDISAYAVKRLINHKMSHDITSGYIIADVERLRKPMQQITDYLCNCMGIKQNGEIIHLQQAGVSDEKTA